MNIKLVRAIFAAGFRVGYEAGSDNATAYEHGSRTYSATTPEDAWAREVEWRLDNPDRLFDITKTEHWENIP